MKKIPTFADARVGQPKFNSPSRVTRPARPFKNPEGTGTRQCKTSFPDVELPKWYDPTMGEHPKTKRLPHSA